MVICTVEVNEKSPQTIVIGRRGTYNTQEIMFDIGYLIDAYGAGTAVLAIKRSQDSSAYPTVVTQEDTTLTWTVSETDTYYVGAGECQLMWYVDGGLAKTIIYHLVVMRDILSTSEEAPDAYQEWVDNLTALGTETLKNAQNAAQSASNAESAKDDAVTAKEAAENAQEAAGEAQQAAETAVTHYPKIVNNYWYVWANGEWVNTGVKAEGVDGRGIVSVTGQKTSTVENVDTYTMMVAYTSGNPDTVTFTVTNGVDGYSPVVTITAITGGHHVTITDKTHPSGQSFDVMDGASDAGQVSYDQTQTYQTGTVGKELSDQKNAISQLDSQVDYNGEVQNNLVLTGTLVKRKYLNASGAVVNEAQYSYAYYYHSIPVVEGKTYYLHAKNTFSYTTCRVHGYDENNSWLKQLTSFALPAGASRDSYAEITIPIGVKYIAVSTADSLYIEMSDCAYINPVPNLVNSSYQENGYVISASGVKTTSSFGIVYSSIDVEPGNYQIKLAKYADNAQVNVRIHGYDVTGNWVSQLSLFELTNYGDIDKTFTVPTGISTISISSSKPVVVTGLNKSPYTQIYGMPVVQHRVTSMKDQYVNMGNPYTYLSGSIEDEILDSTTVDDVYAIYDTLCTNYPKFIQRMPDIGQDESGLTMRLYRVGWASPYVAGAGKESLWNDNQYCDYFNYQKLFVNAGTHGNEKSSVYGVALSIQEIVTSDEPWAQYIRGNFMIDVCPVANPWGYNNTSRNGYGDVNINRDFLTRTRSESQAIYNLVKRENYYAFIDSHNSGGNANYFGITNTNPRLKTYVQMNMKLAGIVYNSWKQLATGDQYAIDPYIQCWVEAPLGMLQDMMNELNIPGYLIESVGVYKSGTGVLTPNHKKYCKFTKDLLINSLIALGSANWID